MSRNKIAIVTGANQGIGYQIAKQIARSGDFATVILACRRLDAGAAAAREMMTTTTTASSHPSGCAVVEAMELDISVPKSIADFASAFANAHGDRLDVLVNNAAMAFKGRDPTPFGLQSRPTIDTNYRGTVGITEALLPYLKRAGPGSRVVNVASRSGALRILRSDERRGLFTRPESVEALSGAMDAFVADAESTGERNGFAGTNYGMSKCGVIAYTALMSRLCPEVGWSAMCPGHCATSMSSWTGSRTAAAGADTASWLATTDDASAYKSGGFFADRARVPW
jgi:carbonyl reductase 1